MILFKSSLINYVHPLKNLIYFIIIKDPVLFSGTLRENLDPLSMHTDAQLHESLALAHLSGLLETIKDGLDHDVGESGESLRFGFITFAKYLPLTIHGVLLLILLINAKMIYVCMYLAVCLSFHRFIH